MQVGGISSCLTRFPIETASGNESRVATAEPEASERKQRDGNEKEQEEQEEQEEKQIILPEGS